MTPIKKVPVPPWQVDTVYKSARGTIQMMKDRIVPGGGWHHVMFQDEGEKKPKPVVVMYCPACGKEGYLTDFVISDEGIPDASIICTHKGCTFHDKVKLLGYEA